MNDDEELKELFGSNEGIDIALSFSRVSDFNRNGPKALNKRTFVDNMGAKIGSITDDWLFDRENFEDKYLIYDGEKPTATLGKLVDIILKNYMELPSNEKVLDIIATNGFWSKYKDDTLDKAYNIPGFWEYLTAQYASKIKTLVTSSELELGKDLAQILQTHEFSKDIFTNDLERINQYKFELFYRDIKFRGIIDMVLIDHKFKTVRLIDLKTGQDSAENFMNSFIKYRYFFQEAIYMKAFAVICEELGLKDYKLLPFQFLYIGRSERLPLVYTISQKWHDAAIKGFTLNGTYQYKGLDEVLEEIVWHWTNKVFDMPKSIYEGNGNIMLNDKFINLE